MYALEMCKGGRRSKINITEDGGFKNFDKEGYSICKDYYMAVYVMGINDTSAF
jgi:hypothetical protein